MTIAKYYYAKYLRFKTIYKITYELKELMYSKIPINVLGIALSVTRINQIIFFKLKIHDIEYIQVSCYFFFLL